MCVRTLESYDFLQVTQGDPVHVTEPNVLESAQPSAQILCPRVSYWAQTDGRLTLLRTLFSEVFWFSFPKNSSAILHSPKSSTGDSLARVIHSWGHIFCVWWTIRSPEGKKVDTDTFPSWRCATSHWVSFRRQEEGGTLTLGIQVSVRILKPSCVINMKQVPPNE